MTLLRRAAAVLLLLVLCPGAGELVENLSVLLSHGHLAHADAGDHHDEPAGPEHGCTGTFHLCPCHPTPSTLLPSSGATLPSPHVEAGVVAVSGSIGTALATDVYRPPRLA